MTAFCLSSTCRSRPTAFFVFATPGGESAETIPEPMPSSVIVDTPEDEPADELPKHDPSANPRPDHKHTAEEEHS